MTTLSGRTLDALPEIACLARCPACEARFARARECPRCGRELRIEEGILHAIGPLSGTNRVAAAFYDGPAWIKFRRWERLFLWFQGIGESAARKKILRHLPGVDRARVLEVGIGDGENVALLPKSWEYFGVDLARSQLLSCRASHPK